MEINEVAFRLAWEKLRRFMIEEPEVPYRKFVEAYEAAKAPVTAQPVGLPSEPEIEQLAISRIATWLTQKYDSEFDASQVPLDTWQAEAREIWALVRHYPRPEREAVEASHNEVAQAIASFVAALPDTSPSGVVLFSRRQELATVLLERFDIRRRGGEAGGAEGLSGRCSRL